MSGTRTGYGWPTLVESSETSDRFTTLKFGSVGSSRTKISPPPFFAQETVKYERYPIRAYGWGAQAEGKFGDGWTLYADLTGPMDRLFDVKESRDFSRPVFGARLAKSFGDKIIGKDLTIGLVVQMSGEFSVFAFDAELKATDKVSFRAMAYHDHEDGQRDTTGAWLLGLYRLNKQVEAQAQFDWQQRGGIIVTTGVRVWPFSGRLLEKVNATFNWEYHTEPADNVFLLRLCFPF